MQVVLVMFRNDGERRSFSVVRNMTIIGRREDCDLRIPVGDVSRKHCRLVRTDDGVRIEDLGSSNGTIVNGQRIQESELNPGDVVGIGPVQFIVQIDGVPDEDEMTPPVPHLPHMDDDEDSMVGRAVATAPANEDSGELEMPAEEIPADELQLEEPVAELPATDDLGLEEATIDEPPLEDALSEKAAAEELPEEEFAIDNDEFPLELEETSPEELPSAKEPVPETNDAETEKPVHQSSDLANAATVTDEPEPVALDAAGESEWDFVVEESDGDRKSHDFKLDLDSPHEQPHQ